MYKDGIIETVFSCIKRMSGGHDYYVKLKNRIQENMSKALLYDKMTICLPKTDGKIINYRNQAPKQSKIYNKID